MCFWLSVRSRWLDIGRIFFFFRVFMDQVEVEVHNMLKKNEANIQWLLTNKFGHLKEFIIHLSIWALSLQRIKGNLRHVKRAKSTLWYVLYIKIPVNNNNFFSFWLYIYCERDLKLELSSQSVIEANNAFHLIFFSFYLKSSVDNLLP